MGDSNVRILRVSYDNVALFKNGKFDISLIATDRVADSSQVFSIYKTIYTQKMIALSGINASGKTSALKLILLAAAIVIDNIGLNTENLYGRELLRDGTVLTVVFCYNDTVYRLESTIGIDPNAKDKYFYREELLYEKPLKDVTSRKNLFEFTGVHFIRSQIPDEMRALLRSDISVALAVTRENNTVLRHMLPYTNLNLALTTGHTPAAVLHLFDEELESLDITRNDDITFQVKFKGSEEKRTVHNVLELGNIISSGTIKGQNIMCLIRQLLQSGGYLLVDELENHLNKEIVHSIIKIFKNEKINKRGACLIFTTHYAEILDFIDRKDNIFILRKNYGDSTGIEMKQFAELVARNDIKKSDIILSNYVGGTAPKYEYIRSLEDFLCSE